jgi:glycosyltransferase involved in cell wall biosynthesis
MRPDDLKLLSDHFDSVVMLTWSDWKTEPRSNRYHYASRFARSLPVFFFQPVNRTALSVESTELPGVEIVRYPKGGSASALTQALELLRARRVRRPLVWVYNFVDYAELIAALGNAFVAFHATEDLVTPSAVSGIDTVGLRLPLANQLAATDLLVAVSDAIADLYCRVAGYSGATLVAPNGCDAGFIQAVCEDRDAGPAVERVAIYQGAINYRIDFGLLARLADRLPNWTFVLSGRADAESQPWQALRARKNVRYLGELDPRSVAVAMHAASVGIIPFLQDPIIRHSLPLKAFEYVAAGLPVVSVPIDALAKHPNLFHTASTFEEFADGLVAASATRRDSAALAERRAAALANSYDARFLEVCESIIGIRGALRRAERRLNVLALFDDAETDRGRAGFAPTLAALSRHSIVFAAAGRFHAPLARIFDAVVVHESAVGHTSNAVAVGEIIREFFGPTVLLANSPTWSPTEATELAGSLDLELVRARTWTPARPALGASEHGIGIKASDSAPALAKDVRNAGFHDDAAALIRALDELLDERVLKGPKYEILFKALMTRAVRGPTGKEWQDLAGEPLLAVSSPVRRDVLAGAESAIAREMTVSRFVQLKVLSAISALRRRARRGAFLGRLVRAMWFALPSKMRDRVYSSIRR